ncbi:MAG: hypothetical protein Q9214_002508, partial [Letrouitia sp. 1 TL-2023]
HQKLALACLRYLSDDNWRHVFALGLSDHGTNKTRYSFHYDGDYPLLLYATHHWAYHVKNSVCTCDELWNALNTFFQGYVLIWIHGIAILSSLQIIVRAGQDLRSFAHRYARIRTGTKEPPTSLRTHDTQWLRSWAIDLIRIVGKFGRALLQNPLSIYRLIPVFCPSKSQIRAVYGGTVEFGISLAGISSSWWDDCIARISGIEDETISRVLSTETNFVTLVSTKGKAIVWSSETCAELRSINHNEYVTHMAINKLGTMLATAGIRTIRIWELSSGKEIYRFPKNSEARTMTISFGHSDKNLIIGREDFSVTSHEISSGLVTSTFWACSQQGTDMNGPRYMTISPDLTKIAVAERGKPVLIWDFERCQIQQPWRCVRYTDRLRDVHEQEAWTASEVVCWHPQGTSILILYQGSGIVHWNFLEDSQKEYSHIEGREMTLTKDSSFLLTSDPRGTLSVWALPRFNLIYKLFYEEIVRDLAFSPDSQRIYDSRGALCNVWEPDVLIRHEDTERDDASGNYESDTESSLLSDPVISQNDSTRTQITALASDSNDQYCCCGRDDGSVAIHSTADGSKARKVYNHSSTVSITALEWSKSNKYIVSGDDAGRIICKRLEIKGKDKWAVFPVFDIRSKDPVRQFLFHPKESSLLISTESTDILWSIRGRRWISCPDNSSNLLCVDPSRISIFGWENLESQQSQPTALPQTVEAKLEPGAGRPPLTSTLSNSAETVRCVSATRNGQHLVVEIIPVTEYSCSLAPRNLKIQHFPAFSSTSSESTAVQRTALPELSQQISRLLGIFNDRVLFLDYTFWNRHIANRRRTILWLNGGPGCSSMDGALMEIGPYRLKDPDHLVYNDGSWDEFANLLFVDNPVGTGYSYVDTDSYVHELTDMANQMVSFLEKFFALFPEHTTDDLYIAGESYAGQHIPYIAKAILDRNAKKKGDLHWNLSGLLIGNGWISPAEQYSAYLEYGYQSGIVQGGTDVAQQLEKLNGECVRKLNEPGGVDQVDQPLCEKILTQMLELTAKDGRCANMYDVRLDDTWPSCGMNWPPDLTSLTPYLRRDQVKEALHVNKDKASGWTECAGSVGAKFHPTSKPSISLLPELLEKIPVLLFSGEKDLICNHLGTEELIHNLKWNGGQGFELSPGTMAPRRDWTFEGESAGIYQEARNLTYVLFYNSSHMVPFDYPRRSRDMLDRFMDVDIASIGGKPADSRIDGEKGIQTSVGGHPNASIAEEQENEKVEAAKYTAYYHSGEIALVVVVIAASVWGWLVCKARRRRAGYQGLFGGSSGHLPRLNKRHGRDVEVADFDEGELDDLHIREPQYDGVEERQSLESGSNGEDEKGQAQRKNSVDISGGVQGNEKLQR